MKPMQTIDQIITEAPEETPNTSPIQRAGNQPTPRPSGRPRVVVVGAGFGGLHAAGKLAHADVDVLVLGRNYYHGFLRLRNQLLRAFERAVVEPDPVRRAALLTLVIVGGGPTGVELAGAFAELIRHVLRKDYPMLNVAQARVLLVEAGDGILASFPERL